MPNIRALPDDLQQIAIEQLNEVPERVEADIQALRTWIEQQPHLKARTDDQFLLAFLRGCKYSMEKAKSKIDRFYTLRSKYPEFFTAHNADFEEMLKVFRVACGVYLPTPLNGNGPRIAVVRMGFYDTNIYTIEKINCAGQLMQDIMLIEDDYAMVNGLIHIMDLAGASTSLFLQMSPSYAKKMTTYAEEALPFRIKAGHFINVPVGFDRIFNMIKPLMSEKTQKRLYLYGSKWESLYEQIPQKYLPIEYGGENGSLPEVISDWEARIRSYRQYFEEEKQYGTNEKLRPGKPIDFENLFGMEGSFRKLNVD